MRWTIVPLLFVLPTMSVCRTDCSRAEYERCVRIADPLVKEARLVFPDNVKDIERVCETWNQFVDCLKAYTDACFTAQQRRQFNRAVESPIESVHQMCMQPGYQREYLQHAPCIKNTIIERVHCGPQYNLLVDQVEQGDIISKSTLCCSHDRFKQCVLRETRRVCDRGVSEGPASRFAGQIIDKALSFLRDQCYNYIPNSGDCTATTSDYLPHADRSDPLSISTSPSEVYPWSTIQQEVQRERLPSRATSPRLATSTTWLPSSSNTPTSGNSPPTDFSTQQMLGTRSRPSSWGRSGGWSESTPQVGSNTVQAYPEPPAGQSPTPSQVPVRDDWAVTMSAWDVRAQPGGRTPLPPGGTTRSSSSSYPYNSYSTDHHFETTPTPWWPANEVDEPNQQGWKGERGAGASTAVTFSLLFLAATIRLIL